MDPHINFPNGTEFEDLTDFSLELEDIPEKKNLKICTKNAGFFTPTKMIFLAKACRDRARKFPNEKLSYRGLDKHGYANNLGFSEALKIKGKPYPQGAFGGKSYIPISGMLLSDLEHQRLGEYGNIGDVIEKKCMEISKIVDQSDKNKELRNTVARSFCEIFRNCFEHGEAHAVAYCAQYWPNSKEVEICIVDRGIGVHASLTESKYTKPENDKEALLYCLMPGVSSKASQNKKKKAHQKTKWDNAGYGLFFAHRLFGQLGKFRIASQSHALDISHASFSDYPARVDGTLVSMRLSLSDTEEIQECLSSLSSLATKVKERLGVKGLRFESVEAFISSGVY